MLNREVVVLRRLTPDRLLDDEAYFVTLGKGADVAINMFKKVLTTTRDNRGAFVFNAGEYHFSYPHLKEIKSNYVRQNVFELMDWMTVVQTNFQSEPQMAQSLKYVGLHTRILQLGREIKLRGRNTLVPKNDSVQKTIESSLSILKGEQTGDGGLIIDLMNSMTWGCVLVALRHPSLFSLFELLGHCGALTNSLDYLAGSIEKQNAEDDQAMDYSLGLARTVEVSDRVLTVVPTYTIEDLRDSWTGQGVGSREAEFSKRAMPLMLGHLKEMNRSAVDARTRRASLMKRLSDRRGRVEPRYYYQLRDYFSALSESVADNLIAPTLERLAK